MFKQLDFFALNIEEKLALEMQEMRNMLDKLRKSQFAKISELNKKVSENEHELETLKSALCRYRNNDFANYPLFVEI